MWINTTYQKKKKKKNCIGVSFLPLVCGGVKANLMSSYPSSQVSGAIVRPLNTLSQVDSKEASS